MEMVSTTDPDAIWATKGRPAMMAYFDNYLIDTSSRVILGMEATPALFHQETVAARKMMERVEKLGVRPESVGADKGYGSGEFLAWLLARGVQPHIPVIDRRHQTAGRFTRDQFHYDPAQDVYYCPRQRQHSAEAVPRKSSALLLPRVGSSYTGTNQPDKRRVLWWARRLTSIPDELVTRSKLSSPS
jgi:hypothetical protein